MVLLRRVIIAVVLIAFVVTVVIVAKSLTSYEWRVPHRTESPRPPENPA